MLVVAGSSSDFGLGPVYPTESFLLATTDGGATWGQVTRWSSPGASAPSQGSCKPGPAVDVMFASTSTGYASVWCNAVGSQWGRSGSHGQSAPLPGGNCRAFQILNRASRGPGDSDRPPVRQAQGCGPSCGP
jgi:hypothetical protein